MTTKRSLKIIFVLSVAGMLFSGYLSYFELFGPGCGQAIISCGPKAFSIAEIPACVYGFFMYFGVFAISLLGIRSKE